MLLFVFAAKLCCMLLIDDERRWWDDKRWAKTFLNLMSLPIVPPRWSPWGPPGRCELMSLPSCVVLTDLLKLMLLSWCLHWFLMSLPSCDPELCYHVEFRCLRRHLCLSLSSLCWWCPHATSTLAAGTEDDAANVEGPLPAWGALHMLWMAGTSRCWGLLFDKNILRQ